MLLKASQLVPGMVIREDRHTVVTVLSTEPDLHPEWGGLNVLRVTFTSGGWSFIPGNYNDRPMWNVIYNPATSIPVYTGQRWIEAGE